MEKIMIQLSKANESSFLLVYLYKLIMTKNYFEEVFRCKILI